VRATRLPGKVILQEITPELLEGATFDLEIANFEKWNPPLKHKNASRRWVKFDTLFFDDPKVADLTEVEVTSYIRLLLLRARSGGPPRKVTTRWIQGRLNLRGRSAGGLLVKLLKLGLFEISNINRPALERRGEERRREERRASAPDALVPPTPISEPLPVPEPIEKRPVKPAAPDGTQRVIARYVELWQARYKSKIHLSGKDIGLLRTLTKDHGEESAIKLLESYLSMLEAWFVTKRHDLVTLTQNLNAVSHFMHTGKVITRKDVKTLESAVNTQNLLDMVDRGEI
jgi:hypothetical protein